jgi:hypothetical protein
MTRKSFLLIPMAVLLLGHSDKCTGTAFYMVSVSQALETYQRRHDRLPTEQESLEVLTSSTSGRPRLMPNVRADSWDTRFIYRLDLTSPVGYELRSAGPDRIAGNQDDLVFRGERPICSTPIFGCQ